MPIETDFYETTVATTKAWVTHSFPTAFFTVPIVLAFAREEKKKSGVNNVTTTGCDITSEVNDLSLMLMTEGFADEVEGIHPQRDAGKEVVTASKIYQAMVFHGTFDTLPSVIGGYEGSTAGGKKISFDSITTTGCDIANEVAGHITTWCAVERGGFP